MNENEDYKRGFNAGFDQGELNGKTLSNITIRQQQAEIEALKKAQMTPYAYAVVQGVDGMENVSLQFDHPEMCGQTYIQAIPLFNHQTEKENQ